MNKAQEMRRLSESGRKVMAENEFQAVLRSIKQIAGEGKTDFQVLLSFPEETVAALVAEGFTVENTGISSSQLEQYFVVIPSNMPSSVIAKGSQHVIISW